MTFLLKAQILSHCIKTTDLELPCAMINCFRPSTVIPRLRIPLTVGKRGSSHPSTKPSFTNHVSFRLDRTVWVIFKREYSQMCGLRSPRASSIQKNWESLSRYSIVRSVCVTFSMESTIGQAKSYVGYTLTEKEFKNSGHYYGLICVITDIS